MSNNTIIDCGSWAYSEFMDKRKEWLEAGFDSNIESGKSTIFAKESDVLAKFPELKQRIIQPNQNTFAEDISTAFKELNKT